MIKQKESTHYMTINQMAYRQMLTELCSSSLRDMDATQWLFTFRTIRMFSLYYSEGERSI